jgi:hypothetical protein
VLACAVVLERVKPIALEVAEFAQTLRRVEQRQPPHRTLLHIGAQAPTAVTVPDAFGFGVGEAADHIVPFLQPTYASHLA